MNRHDWLSHVLLRNRNLFDLLARHTLVSDDSLLSETHLRFIRRFLAGLEPRSLLLSAGCGAGQEIGLLLEAGHALLAIEESQEMLARAEQRYPIEQFPGLSLAALNILDLHPEDALDGILCVHILEHVPPEDWIALLSVLWSALKPGVLLYVAVEAVDLERVLEAERNATAQGLPVRQGEIADQMEEAWAGIQELGDQPIPAELIRRAAYRFCPSYMNLRYFFDTTGWLTNTVETVDNCRYLLARKPSLDQEIPLGLQDALRLVEDNAMVRIINRETGQVISEIPVKRTRA